LNILKKNFTKNPYNYKKNLGVFLVLLESPQWIAFNEGDLKFFRLKVWNILNFK
jgi:hypothetical protein